MTTKKALPDSQIIEELHWQAGMFEGEGSIRVSTPTPRNMGALVVDVTNTDETVVLQFHSIWGGSIRSYPAQENRKPYWRWRAAAWNAHAFLIAMWPCLRTEKYRRRAVLGIEFQEQKQTNFSRGHRASAEYVADQLWFYERMKTLNQRGTCPNAKQFRRKQ